MSHSEDEVVDGKSSISARSYSHTKYYANRRFRPAWSEKYPWIQDNEGRAYCVACNKYIGNHNAHISRHGQNKSHCRRLKEMDHKMLDTPDKLQILSEPNDSILSDTNDMRESRDKPALTNSSENYLKECERVVEVWALKLNRMDPTQQMFAEKFINDILFEGQMGTLHRNSLQLNILETVYHEKSVPGNLNFV